jgi:hypothetical protein
MSMIIAQPTKESIKVLEECAAVQKKKGADYQNPNSNVKQAMHYRRGIDSIHDLLQGKLYRAQSLLEAAHTPNQAPNFESIEDTYMDLINYASFAVEYLRGKMDGQDPNRDIFNRPKPTLPSALPGSTISSISHEDNGKHM